MNAGRHRATHAAVWVMLALVVSWPARPAAHDPPTDVLVQAFMKPEGQRLRLLVRVPLAAMRDIEFPVRGPGYLELGRATAAVRTAAVLWVAGSVTVYEEDRALDRPELAAVQVSLPSDRSFAAWDDALAHVTGASLPPDTELLRDQALLDVLLEYDITSEASAWSIDSDFARLGVRVATTLRFLPPDGEERALTWVGERGLVRLDPRWHQAALSFIVLGFEHILGGIDHLLFLLCLIVPFRRLKHLVAIVTGFTVAHSITLISAALGVVPDALWFPPLIETLIAATIVYMAIENIIGTTALRRRWILTCAFGLIHGFGFSFALSETLQFAGPHLLTSLVSFNVGVELGQLLVVSLLVPAVVLAFRHVAPERVGTIILSALVLHTAWHWMVERGRALSAYSLSAQDVVLLADVFRWTMRGVVAAGVIWLLASFARQATERRRASDQAG